MELFWVITPAERAKLMQLQDELYGTALDIASEIPPWLIKPPLPAVQPRTDMTPEELQVFISSNSDIKARVK